MTSPIDALVNMLCRQIAGSGSQLAWSDEVFLGWAQRIARAQAFGAGPLGRPRLARISDLAEVPPVTAETFRYLDVRAFGDEHTVVERFLTSGTLSQHRGCHRLYRRDIYDVSALTAFDLLVGACGPFTSLVSLVPPREQRPDSSLSYMVTLLGRECFAGRVLEAVGLGGLDVERLLLALPPLVRQRPGPVLVFTTTLAAQDLLAAASRIALPSGSLILTTGGTKGRLPECGDAELDRRLSYAFPGALTGAEYGMTELLSQAYRLGQTPFRLPPWCRVLAVDAEGQRLPHGRRGLLRFIDLANVQSAVAVQTADLGATHSDQTFTLAGRVPGRRLRGCSLTYGELSPTAPHAA